MTKLKPAFKNYLKIIYTLFLGKSNTFELSIQSTIEPCIFLSRSDRKIFDLIKREWNPNLLSQKLKACIIFFGYGLIDRNHLEFCIWICLFDTEAECMFLALVAVIEWMLVVVCLSVENGVRGRWVVRGWRICRWRTGTARNHRQATTCSSISFYPMSLCICFGL